jgi:S1-C subfamily serine protease
MEDNMDQANTNGDVLAGLSNGLADAVERAGRSLVKVNGRHRQAASGVVFKEGLVLTADHVIEREEDLTIETADGQTLAAQFAGRDPSSDLAVLRVEGLAGDIAETAGPARVGQLVLAVGRPTDQGPMASIGIVSAIGGPVRAGRGGMLERYIRTDATPYPGFSGGPLIDATGAVLGITTTGLANGVALAIPSEIAWRVADTLARHGQIKRGYLGISSQPVQLPEAQRGGQAQEGGLLLVRVEPGSPAEKGGLLLGDIIIALDGQPVTDTDSLQGLLTGDRVGNAVPIQVLRGGAAQTVQVTIGERG